MRFQLVGSLEPPIKNLKKAIADGELWKGRLFSILPREWSVPMWGEVIEITNVRVTFSTATGGWTAYTTYNETDGHLLQAISDGGMLVAQSAKRKQ